MIDNLRFARLSSQPTKKASCGDLAISRGPMVSAICHESADPKSFSEVDAMYKASRSAKVRDTKLSVERRKTWKVFGLWQVCLLGGILLLAGTGFAQLSSASLSGVVRD